MTFNDLFALALTNLGRQRLRTFLTVSGVTIGVGALVLLVSLGLGLEGAVLSVFEVGELLTKVEVTRWRKGTEEKGPPEGFSFQRLRRRDQLPLTEADAAALRAIPGVTAVYSPYKALVELSLAGSAEGAEKGPAKDAEKKPAGGAEKTPSGAESAPAFAEAPAGPPKLDRSEGGESPRPMIEAQLKAVPAAEAAELYARHLLGGRLWASEDADEAVLPSGVVRRLFHIPAREEPDPAKLIGTKVRLAPLLPIFRPSRGPDPSDPPPTERVLTLVGIYRSAPFGEDGMSVLVSHANGRRLFEAFSASGGVTMFFGRIAPGEFPQLTVRVAGPEQVADVAGRIEALGYETTTAREIAQSIRRNFLVVEGTLAAIGGIGLLVAFFGIMNTMSMAILERTREIGILKALGTRPRDVRRLFLAEAAMIGAMGALIGVVSGWVIGGLFDWAAHRRFPDIPAETSLFVVTGSLTAGAILFAILVSALAGLIPAVRAGRLDPVAAIRQ